MSDWKNVRIGDFLFERKGKFSPDDDKVKNLQRIVKIDFDGNIHLDYKKSRTRMILIKDGDFVISGINVAKGAMAVYRGDTDVTATIHYSSYWFDTNLLDIEYFEWFLRSDEFQFLLKKQVKGGIKTEIKAKHLLPLRIDLPDLKTQKEIIQKINKHQSKISLLRLNIESQSEKIEMLRGRFFQDAITGKLSKDWRVKKIEIESASKLLEKIKLAKKELVNKKIIKKRKSLPKLLKEEIQFQIPKNWIWVRLGELLESIDYGTSEKAKKDEPGVPVLAMGNIQNNKVILNNTKFLDQRSKDLPRLYLKKNDLLFNRTNSYELVGKSAVFVGEDNSYTFASYLIRLRFVRNLISAEYINVVLNSDWFKHHVINPKIVQQTGQANFNGTKLQKSPIPLPPYSEQIEISKKISRLENFLVSIDCRNQQNLKNIDLLEQEIINNIFK